MKLTIALSYNGSGSNYVKHTKSLASRARSLPTVKSIWKRWRPFFQRAKQGMTTTKPDLELATRLFWKAGNVAEEQARVMVMKLHGYDTRLPGLPLAND